MAGTVHPENPIEASLQKVKKLLFFYIKIKIKKIDKENIIQKTIG